MVQCHSPCTTIWCIGLPLRSQFACLDLLPSSQETTPVGQFLHPTSQGTAVARQESLLASPHCLPSCPLSCIGSIWADHPSVVSLQTYLRGSSPLSRMTPLNNQAHTCVHSLRQVSCRKSSSAQPLSEAVSLRLHLEHQAQANQTESEESRPHPRPHHCISALPPWRLPPTCWYRLRMQVLSSCCSSLRHTRLCACSSPSSALCRRNQWIQAAPSWLYRWCLFPCASNAFQMRLERFHKSCECHRSFLQWTPLQRRRNWVWRPVRSVSFWFSPPTNQHPCPQGHTGICPQWLNASLK